MRLKDKICLVVGASSGMGRETARRIAHESGVLIAAARRTDAVEALVAELNAEGSAAHALTMDGTDPDSIEAGFAWIADRFGRLDGAFNNLGATYGNSPLHETPNERWHDTIATNLTAPFLLMKAEIPLLKAAGGGAIVNNSSSAGVRGVPAMSDYAASKWGLIGLTQSAALDYGADDIRVNVIAPGIIETEKAAEMKAQMPDLFEQLRSDIPLGRFGQMSDIAGLVTWLLSDEARYVTGATIRIDAGQTIG
jgi:NAD(P)-dependent dehydrogenase (short-subunit alcohol dehydrogenase family)